MIYNSNEIMRIKIKQIHINKYNDPLNIQIGFSGFDSKYLAQYLQNYLKIKPIKALIISYNKLVNDIDEITNGYCFLDFIWDNSNKENEHALNLKKILISEKEITIPFSSNENWIIKLQSKSVNLLTNSSNSIITYFIDKNFNIPKNDQEYNKLCENIMKSYPFTANEPEPKLGYRDSYINLFVRI